MSRYRILATWGFAALFSAFSTAVSAGEAESMVVERGRVSLSGKSVEAGAPLAFGQSVEVLGPTDATLTGPGGLRLRAIPQTQLRLERGDATMVLRLERGAVSAATANALRVETPAGSLDAEGARFIARLATAGGLYVEHRQDSTGTLSVTAPGGEDKPLAAGSFRMLAPEPETAAAPAVIAPDSHIQVATETTETSTEATTETTTEIAAEEAPIAPKPPEAPVAPTAPVAPPPPAVEPKAPAAPCEPTVIAPPPPPPSTPAPAPQAMPSPPARPAMPMATAPSTCRTCKAAPKKSALPGRPCCNHAETCCGAAIPFVRYREGGEEAITFKLGYRVVTVRPAGMLRATRRPDGGMTLRNRGDCLIMVVLDDNQFAYIGCKGSLGLSCEGQVECFRGITHLYGRKSPPCYRIERRRRHKECEPPKCEPKEPPCDPKDPKCEPPKEPPCDPKEPPPCEPPPCDPKEPPPCEPPPPPCEPPPPPPCEPPPPPPCEPPPPPPCEPPPPPPCEPPPPPPCEPPPPPPCEPPPPPCEPPSPPTCDVSCDTPKGCDAKGCDLPRCDGRDCGMPTCDMPKEPGCDLPEPPRCDPPKAKCDPTPKRDPKADCDPAPKCDPPAGPKHGPKDGPKHGKSHASGGR